MATSDEPSLLDRLRPNGIQLLTGPAVVWFVVFLLIPLAFVVYYSFLTYASFSVIHEFTLGAWRSGVFTATFAQVFTRTLAMAIFVTVLCLLVGYPVAYFLRFHMSMRSGIILLLFLVIPFWTAEMIRVIAWLPILTRSGVVNIVLQWIGVIDEPLSWLLFSPFSQVLGYLQNYVVFMLAPIYISLAQIDEGLLDASETLRGNPVETFRHVTWPLSLPGVIIGCIFTFVLTMGNFLVPEYLSGGRGAVSTLIYLAVNTGLKYPVAGARAITLLVVIFAVVYLMTRIVDISEIAR